MAELSESEMNFAALTRVDPYAKSLLATAAHVALYTFVDNEWDRTDIEGALFVYSRTGEPYHNILIMNRLNMNNLVEPLTPGLDLQLQDPFLLYRNPQGLIYGIWFYDKEECIRISEILDNIIHGPGDNPNKKGRNIRSGGKNVDIFSMLTKAQEEYNSKSPRKTQPGTKVSAALHDLNFNLKDSEPTSQSVMDFFAKASNGSKFGQDKITNQPPGMFLNNPRPGPPGINRLPSLPISIPPPQNDVRPLLQRLMSNPVHSVEHIEKQQQAITPQKDFVGMMKNGNTGLSTNIGNESKTKPNLCYNAKQSTEQGGSDVGKPIKGNSTVNSQNQIDNSLGFLRISDSPPNSTVHSQQFFNSKFSQNHSPVIGDRALDSSSNNIETHRPLSAPMETQLKPALMPPVMFTTSVKKEEYTESVSTITPVVMVNTSSGNTFPVHPEPLTKNQLLQAVNYLLKHDTDFINKLHEAYVKSFTELVQ